MQLADRIKSERLRLQEEYLQLQEKLKYSRNGYFTCYQRGRSFVWYQVLKDPAYPNRGKRVYISKKKADFARKLALQTLWERRRRDIQRELKALDAYIRRHNWNVGFAEQYMNSTDEHRRLLRQQSADELWQQAEYEHFTAYPEGLTVKTVRGELVRSKSEAIIAMVLNQYGVPYHYEEMLRLDGQSFAPDFTIRNPLTGEVVYWEHLGLMDDADYCMQNARKLQAYMQNGLIPNLNLILTSETAEHPLDLELVTKLVEHFFT